MPHQSHDLISVDEYQRELYRRANSPEVDFIELALPAGRLTRESIRARLDELADPKKNPPEAEPQVG